MNSRFSGTQINFIFSKTLALLILLLTNSILLFSQSNTQYVSGLILDQESHQICQGAYVICETCQPKIMAVSDSTGKFRIPIPFGRQSFSVQYLGYNARQINDVQVGSGKEVFFTIELTEQIFQTDEVSVKAASNRWINPMATVSARTLRSQDAGRYAAGYFDASRMVVNFAGVSSGNGDDSNEIIIRGNSPRGLLWRLEGIEIPNPNHFANGQGSSGGGYSSITTNILSGFDFFTGAFPAEYSNATSGVMDLNLRSGNSDDREYSLAMSVLGMEASAEGPWGKRRSNSFLFDYRLADFRYLTKLGILNEKDLGIVPRTSDYMFKSSFKTKRAGSFDLFALGGSSLAGDLASTDIDELKNGGDQDEYIERQTTAIAGVKHVAALSNNKTYFRSTLAFTYQFSSNKNQKSDTLLNKALTYYDYFEYPAIRFSSLMNYKINAQNSLRAGFTFNQLFGQMFSRKLNTSAGFDTLMNASATGAYGSVFAQWKYRLSKSLETNTGLNILISGITHEVVFEPRWGMIVRLPFQQSVNLGFGLHSRMESLAVYNYRTKVDNSLREERNLDLKSTKAMHLVAGYTKGFGSDIQFSMEAYWQNLWAVPIKETPTGQFSILNSIGGLSDVIMANLGKGRNKGVEFTLEKSFSRQYYFLATTSLFDSKYLAPDGNWYNTYFNTNYVSNILAGKEFSVGKNDQNSFGIKLKANFRGGFRYTPVLEDQSILKKKLIYNTAETYGERLPDFQRFDFGFSYRINRSKTAWTLLADIQNIGNTKNVIRRKFEYRNKQVITLDSKGIGIVPVITVKAEF